MTAQVSPRFLPHPVVPWGPGAVLELLRLLTTPDPSYVVNLGDTPRETSNQFRHSRSQRLRGHEEAERLVGEPLEPVPGVEGHGLRIDGMDNDHFVADALRGASDCK